MGGCSWIFHLGIQLNLARCHASMVEQNEYWSLAMISVTTTRKENVQLCLTVGSVNRAAAGILISSVKGAQCVSTSRLMAHKHVYLRVWIQLKTASVLRQQTTQMSRYLETECLHCLSMTTCDTVPRSLRAINVYFLKCCLYTLLIVSLIIVSCSVSYKQNERNIRSITGICNHSTITVVYLQVT